MARYYATPKGKAALARNNKKGRLRRIGWSEEASCAAREAQNHRCAICPRWLAEGMCHDHEHVKPPKPRGILCRACNLSLGYYEGWQRPLGLVIDVYERYLEKF